jgi:hypothetical protein
MAGPTNGTAGGGGGTPKDPEATRVNEMMTQYLFIILGSLSVVLAIWRFTTVLIRYVRTVTSLNNDTQRYFAIGNEKWAFFKKNFQYAPIFSKRHNREFQLSSAINVGTLPTRLQLVFLMAYFATNVAFCVITIDYSGPFRTVAALVRNRSGYLAVVNMVPLFVFAGRNNPLIKLLGISFDTFNLLHRWLGRIVVLESLVHTMAFLVSSASASGWSAAFSKMFAVPYMLWGFVVCCHLPFAPYPQLANRRRQPLLSSSLASRPPASSDTPTMRRSRSSTS